MYECRGAHGCARAAAYRSTSSLSLTRPFGPPSPGGLIYAHMFYTQQGDENQTCGILARHISNREGLVMDDVGSTHYEVGYFQDARLKKTVRYCLSGCSNGRPCVYAD